MLKIGVTGNIGAGKSLVCSIFELLDISVYYADYHARRLMVEDSNLKNNIRELLGEAAYLKNGELDRSYVANQIFNNKSKIEALNSLVHPAVGIDFSIWAEKKESPYVIKEAALLFEAGSYKQLDYTILISADQEVRLHRVLARDKSSREDVLKRMENQMPEEEKKKMADHIIDNNGNKPLVGQVLDLHRHFMTLISES